MHVDLSCRLATECNILVLISVKQIWNEYSDIFQFPGESKMDFSKGFSNNSAAGKIIQDIIKLLFCLQQLNFAAVKFRGFGPFLGDNKGFSLHNLIQLICDHEFHEIKVVAKYS